MISKELELILENIVKNYKLIFLQERKNTDADLIMQAKSISNASLKNRLIFELLTISNDYASHNLVDNSEEIHDAIKVLVSDFTQFCQLELKST